MAGQHLVILSVAVQNSDNITAITLWNVHQIRGSWGARKAELIENTVVPAECVTQYVYL